MSPRRGARTFLCMRKPKGPFPGDPLITDHPSPLAARHVGSTPAKGVSGVWYFRISDSLEVFQRWHSPGAGSCDTGSHQLATHCCITHFGDFVLHIFPRGCPVRGWQFLIFSFASSFVHFVTIVLPFGKPVGPHCLHSFLLHTSFPMSVFPHAQYHYSSLFLSH